MDKLVTYTHVSAHYTELTTIDYIFHTNYPNNIKKRDYATIGKQIDFFYKHDDTHLINR